MTKTKKKWSPNGYLFAAFRKIWRWSPDRKRCLESAQEGSKFICNDCKKRFDREGIAIDHKEPVIDPNKGFNGWDTYYARLFCTPDSLQVLCKSCHAKKTKLENKLRRETSRNRKRVA